jgi:hypothetical protein
MASSLHAESLRSMRERGSRQTDDDAAASGLTAVKVRTHGEGPVPCSRSASTTAARLTVAGMRFTRSPPLGKDNGPCPPLPTVPVPWNWDTARSNARRWRSERDGGIRAEFVSGTSLPRGPRSTSRTNRLGPWAVVLKATNDPSGSGSGYLPHGGRRRDGRYGGPGASGGRGGPAASGAADGRGNAPRVARSATVPELAVGLDRSAISHGVHSGVPPAPGVALGST